LTFTLLGKVDLNFDSDLPSRFISTLPSRVRIDLGGLGV